MAKVFLDTNILMDLVERKSIETEEMLKGQEIFVSVLSIHIVAYLLRLKIPNEMINGLAPRLNLVEFGVQILKMAIEGPTEDLEDNIQLHSAVAVDCDVFLTSDKKLLKLGYFGKTRISDRL